MEKESIKMGVNQNNINPAEHEQLLKKIFWFMMHIL
jgi:hypothetical protein